MIMKRTNTPGCAMTRQETLCGIVYMIFQFVFLPSMLYAVNDLLKHPFGEAELNFLYYFINFIAMLVLFHNFLGNSAGYAWRHLSQLCQAVILGLAAYYACLYVVDKTVSLLVPDKNGDVADVVLGFQDVNGHRTSTTYFGATVGRNANRIGGAQFGTIDIDGRTFITMDYAKKEPELVQRMIDEGHAVGNHTTTHPNMPKHLYLVFHHLQFLHTLLTYAVPKHQ